MVKRIVLLVMLSTAGIWLSAAWARADDLSPSRLTGQTAQAAPQSPQGFQQDLIPNEPLSHQHILESVWVLVIFGLMVAILYPTAWKQVLAGLKGREERIRKAIAEAESARAAAEKTLAQQNAQLAAGEQKVRDLLNQAAADAEKIATNITMKAQHEAEEAKTRAMKEIEAAGRAAMDEIYKQTANLATNVAEKIIRRSLNADDQRDLVNKSLEELQKSRN
jgi:F-type H+-transporting ATPase subunit b